MRLLFVSTYYPPYSVGGAEESTFILAGALARRDHDVTVVAPRLGPEMPDVDFHFQTLDVGLRALDRSRPHRPAEFDNPLLQLRVAARVARFAKRSDLVHCQALHVLPGAYLGAKLARRPMVATIRDLGGVCSVAVCLLEASRVPHDCGVIKLQTTCTPRFIDLYGSDSRPRTRLATLVGFLTARARSRILRRCDAVFSVSADLGAIYAEAGLLQHGQALTLRNAAVHSPHSDGRDGAHGYALYAGKVSPGKGSDYLLEAVALVRRSEPDFRLVVAGHAEPMWSERIRRSDGVEFVGRMPRAEVLPLYDGARLALVPSVWPEPLPRAALEAASQGVPVVGTRVGGIPDAVLHGETGLLVEPRNSQELADAILTLWRDRALASRLGEGGRRYARSRFSPDAVALDAEKLYARVVPTA
jgi:glycosyltransferase involved in cell wall biosynthesis